MVRFGIFSRLFLGFMAVLIPVLTVNGYLITRFNSLTVAAHHILNTDTRLINHGRKMSDTLLTQVRHERKYIILRDKTLLDNYMLSGTEFSQYLSESLPLADSPARKKALTRIAEAHSRYQDLFTEELARLKTGREYLQKTFLSQKNRETTIIFDEIREMRENIEKEMYQKIAGLETATASAYNIAMTMGGMALIWGLLVAIAIARGIARPIARVIDKTREVSRGAFSGDLRLTSPPEMAELAQAFNSMCVRLAEVDRMKSDFFSSMSHELRTPLTCIKMGTSQLREGMGGPLSEKQERIMAIIAEECDRLIGLVNSLLDLSKMEAGMVKFNFSESEIMPVIRRACKLIEPLAAAKEISLINEAPPELPPVAIDGERILQALLNLVGNAVKFTPQGGEVKVSSRINEGRLEVSVTDTGPGIPEEDLARVFDKFHQTTASGSYHIKGTGLGLTIAKHIITAHGGRIWAESTTGRGSSFIFSLPLP
jgi:two-component system sensor histidine kinase GlrK